MGRVDFSDITDHIVLVTYIMRRMGLTKTERKRFINGYEAVIEQCRAEPTFNVYSRIIRATMHGKN